MIALILLLSLFCKSIQDENGQENGVLQCGPRDVASNSSDQLLLLTWRDDPSCSALRDVLIYELEVLVADKRLHYDEVSVTPGHIGLAHFWNWTSFLALECASHSVRLRSRYNNHTSPWKQEDIHPVNQRKKYQVYPRNRVFEVGSTATFCCLLPKGESFYNMSLWSYGATNMNTTKISDDTYALTVHLNNASECSVDVLCQTTRTRYGGSNFIGYPPDDRDLQCDTRDLESVECHWRVGRNTHLICGSPTRYHLLGSYCGNDTKDKCSQKLQPAQLDAGERNWTLKAQNKLGTVELHDRADLTKRVHMLAPEGATASTVNARNASLTWMWTVQRYKDLNITCQANLSNHETSIISENFGVGLKSIVLNDLIPNWTYDVKVRCGTTQDFWKWGDWSKSVSFHTKGDVPDVLDVWMQMKDNQAEIIWKMPLANQSHGDLIDYEVTWGKIRERHQQSRTNIPHGSHSLTLSLNTSEEHIVTVTARNINGSSSPATITIPIFNPDTPGVNISWITGSNGSFTLSWPASPTASCGYIVDWCPTVGNGTVEWLRLPPSNTNASIFSKTFKDGLRYSLSIYACTQGAPLLLQRREGYVKETRIEDNLFKLKFNQHNLDVEVSWDPIPLRELTAFIQGYTMYYQDGNGKVFNVSIVNPGATSLTARNLKITSYTFAVTAVTAVGECGNTSITATLNSQTDSIIMSLLICLGAIFGLLSLTTIICYRHWACIKQKVYPPIPKPVLTDKWLTSPGQHRSHHLRIDQRHHSEADIPDIPELHYKSGIYVSHEDMPFAFTQTPIGYYNKPLQKYTSPPLLLPTTVIFSPMGLPSSLPRGVFPNPSYNPVMQTEAQQSSSGPGPHEGMPIMGSSNGYQPQDFPETLNFNHTEEEPDSPMSCVSTYVLLPSST